MNTTVSIPGRTIVHATPLPPEGLAVRLSFAMLKKYSFDFVVFLGADGSAEISEDELLAWFDQERSMFIMDYVDARTNFIGQVTAKVLNTSELQGALRAFEKYSRYSRYPDHYRELLNRAIGRGQDPAKYHVVVQLEERAIAEGEQPRGMRLSAAKNIRAASDQMDSVPRIRSSPRKRGPRATDRKDPSKLPWIPAFAGMSG
jgi:hypothetical protein